MTKTNGIVNVAKIVLKLQKLIKINRKKPRTQNPNDYYRQTK